MKITSAERIQESIVERSWQDIVKQDEMKDLTRRSILRIIERVKSSQLSYGMKKQLEAIQEFETLNAMLSEIWNVRDAHQLETIINKYDWLEEMKRLDEE